ncbi:MAG: hypothetical protein KY460_15730 [Actinobacteria bacterium]|nr:hypothetical protein [Actinomycetota bacterium]
MITDSQFESMTAMAAAVRDRDVSPVELLNACIERIEQRNPSLDGLDPWDGDIYWAKVGLLVRSATPVRWVGRVARGLLCQRTVCLTLVVHHEDETNDGWIAVGGSCTEW